VRPSSAKAKGRKLQQWVVDKLVAILGFDPEDLESRPMGSSGEDVIMGVQSRKQFPYSIECKNQEAVNVWKAYEQSCTNCKDYEPLVIIKRNNTKPLAVVDAEYFIKLHEGKDGTRNKNRNTSTSE
tara:strand:+ start:276 stop:653 length:378 start_codon:yes stop_codon:yes gene_type:complete